MRALIASCLLLWSTAAAPAQPLQDRLPTCFACHGERGQSQTPDVPSLGGEPSQYAALQLVMFRDKMRKVDLMNEMVKGLSDDDLQKLADLIAVLPPPKATEDAVDAARIARARAIVMQNRCEFCHQPNFAGHENVPRLAGQREDYLVKALRDYKSGARTGYDQSMLDVTAALNDEQMVDLAYFLARAK